MKAKYIRKPMNPKYMKTQTEIRDRIAAFIKKSKLSGEQLSTDILGKSAKYLSNSATTDRIIGMTSLKCIATLVPMPKRLIDAAEREDAERLVKRGRRRRVDQVPPPPKWKSAVDRIIEENSVVNRHWGKVA